MLLLHSILCSTSSSELLHQHFPSALADIMVIHPWCNVTLRSPPLGATIFPIPDTAPDFFVWCNATTSKLETEIIREGGSREGYILDNVWLCLCVWRVRGETGTETDRRIEKWKASSKLTSLFTPPEVFTEWRTRDQEKLYFLSHPVDIKRCIFR